VLIWASPFLGYHKDSWLAMALVCAGCLTHGLWLLFLLQMCGITRQDNGSLLPMKFRSVLYLDVFGWLGNHGDGDGEITETDLGKSHGGAGLGSSNAGRQVSNASQAHGVFGSMDASRQVSNSSWARQFSHDEVNKFEKVQRPIHHKARRPSATKLRKTKSVSGQIPVVPRNAFSAGSYLPSSQDPQDSLASFDRDEVAPARLFCWCTKFLAFLWISAFIMPFAGLWSNWESPKRAQKLGFGPNWRAHLMQSCNFHRPHKVRRSPNFQAFAAAQAKRLVVPLRWHAT